MISQLQIISRKLTLYPIGLYLGLTNKRYGREHRVMGTKTYQWINTVGANFVAEKIRKSQITDFNSKLEVETI
jgi:hypothetical protein